MGFPPREIEAMTHWQYLVCFAGVAKSRGWELPQKFEMMSEEKLAELGVEGF